MTQNEWPDDADGDVMRRLAASGFDFGQTYEIDFIVDFSDWPPPAPALTWISETYSEPVLHDAPENGDGYVRFIVKDKVSYELVTRIQQHVSENLHQHRAICDSWGVLHGGAA